MQLDWENLFKRYIIDDEKTPYFTAVSRLTRRQARYELFTYCLLTGVVYAIAGLASLSVTLPHAGAVGVSLYAFSLLFAVLLLGFTRDRYAAAYCGTAPVGVTLYFLQFGFQPDAATGDKVLIAVILLLWLRYNLRVLGIARAYGRMPETSGPTR
jgi:hypothetical protein